MRKVPSNREVFELAVGLILSQLYEKFPVRIDLGYSKTYETICSRFPNDKAYEYARVLEVLAATIQWLQQADYVWCGPVEFDQAREIVLSEKGLRALRALPKGLDTERQTLGEYFISAAKDGAKDLLLHAVCLLLGASSG
jgi:hypothetical protein